MGEGSASNDNERGSSSHVLMAVFFNTSHTIDCDTGWKEVSGDPSKTVWVTGGRGMVWELRLSRMVEILFTKKSQNLCGRSTDGTEDGRDEVFDLPRRVFVMLNCLDEVHARILVLIYVTLESFQEHFVRTIIYYYYYIYIYIQSFWTPELITGNFATFQRQLLTASLQQPSSGSAI